jgi:hypothetical protein
MGPRVDVCKVTFRLLALLQATRLGAEMRLLVVENDEEFGQAVTDGLKNAALEIGLQYSSSDGDAALNKIEHSSIVWDPGTSGVVAAAVVQAFVQPATLSLDDAAACVVIFACCKY